MSGDFVSFENVRRQVDDLLELHEIPTNFSPLYFVRKLLGRIGVTGTRVRGSGSVEPHCNVLPARLYEKLGAYGDPTDDGVLFVEPGLLETLEEGSQKLCPGVYWVDRTISGHGW